MVFKLIALLGKYRFWFLSCLHLGEFYLASKSFWLKQLGEINSFEYFKDICLGFLQSLLLFLACGTVSFLFLNFFLNTLFLLLHTTILCTLILFTIQLKLNIEIAHTILSIEFSNNYESSNQLLCKSSFLFRNHSG